MPKTIAGVGLGLRKVFAEELLRSERRVDFLEITPENWVTYGGWRRQVLEACAERWPVTPHSVSLSVGGPDPLDESFLAAVQGLVERYDAPFWSDHVCYSSINGAQLHDLLPLPFNAEAVEHTAARARAARARVGRPLALENATFYATMPGSTMGEAEFLRAILEQADLGMLLDVNNVYVNAKNHGFDPRPFIDAMPLERVVQLHVAGHTVMPDVIIDTHIGPVIDDVWALYRYTLQKAGRMIPTVIEWDQDIPPLPQVLDEVDRARAEAQAALGRPA